MRDALRALLKQTGVTREVLAAKCRVTKQAVDKWLAAPLPPARRIKTSWRRSLRRRPKKAPARQRAPGAFAASPRERVSRTPTSLMRTSSHLRRG